MSGMLKSPAITTLGVLFFYICIVLLVIISSSHPQSDGAGNTRCQTTRAPQEDIWPQQMNEDMAGVVLLYPGCGPRPEGVGKEDKADPYEIGKGPPR